MTELLRSFARSTRVQTDPTRDAGPSQSPGITVPNLRSGNVLVDARAPDSSPGIRSVTEPGSRQLVAEADGLMVVLDIHRVLGLNHLTGQVIGGASVGCVQAVRDDVEMALSVVDGHGEFELSGVSCGPLELVVADGRTELVIGLDFE
ncbi:MAG: hypothetical protein ACFCVK_03475 [Acidimicrobiales bacterium]